MVVHELTTNAAKHGALSTPSGRVGIDWTIERGPGRDVLRLTWSETGGPPVGEPTRRGFGSSLIERVVGRQLCGTVDRRFEESGVQVTVTMPLPQAAAAVEAPAPAPERVAALA
jgi:two-component sensor histidine kinase